MLSSGPRTIPGGWGKDLQSEGRPAYSDIGDDVSTNELAVGVVNADGEVLNDADEPVGKIEEGEPEYIVGGVVNASGEVIGKSGDVVGKALPLDDASEKAPEGAVTKGGWTVIGTVKNVTDVLGASKSAGKAAKNAASALGFGSGSSSQQNDNADDDEDQSVLETRSKSPINLEDKEKDPGSEKAESTPAQETPATEKSSYSTSQVSRKADSANGASRAADDAASKLSKIPEETASYAGTAPEETPSQIDDAAEDYGEEASEVPESQAGTIPEEGESQAGTNPEEAGSQAGTTYDDAKSTASKVPDEDAGSVATRDFGADVTADDSVSQVGKTDEAKSTASKIGSQLSKAGSQVSKPAEEAGDELPEGEVPAEGEAAEDADDNKTQASKAGTAKTGATKSVASTFGSQYLRDEEEWDPLARPFERFEGAIVGEDGRIMHEDESIGVVADGADIEALAGKLVNAEGEILNDTGTVLGMAELKDEIKEQIIEEAGELDYSVLQGAKVNKAGNLVNEKGDIVGRVIQGNLKLLYGKECDEAGLFWNDKGKQIGKAEPSPEQEPTEEPSPFEDFPDAYVEANGDIMFNGEVVGKLVDGDPKKLKGKTVDKDGDIVDKNGNVLGHAERWEPEPEAEPEKLDTSILKGAKANKLGNVVNDKGETIGHVVEGVLKQLIGKRCDENGLFFNDLGQQIGRAEPIPEKDREEFKEPSPFEDFPGAIVESNGDVTFNGEVIGKVVEGDPKKLKGKKVDDDGDILDKNGNVLGHAERWEAPEAEVEKIDTSVLKGAKVNKAGNVVNDKGETVGRIVEGILKQLIGKRCDENGLFFNDLGHQIGRAEPIPEKEREEFKDSSPFEDFPGAIVESNGDVVFNGEVIGKVIEGDPKKLKGKKVDDDGDILDKNGNVLGRAERWEAPVAEKDLSVLKGARVNKAGNLVNERGEAVGRLVEGVLKNLIGKQCDENGQFWNDEGHVVGRAEPIPDSEREAFKEPAPFEDFPDATVQSNGDVVSGGEVIGKIVSGDPKKLKGKKVDDDGDVLDRSGNVLGHAERWDEPEAEAEPEKDLSILAGKRVNKVGNVVDSSGVIYGRLIEGDAKRLAGRMCDKDGNVRSESGDILGKADTVSEGEREGLKEGPFAELPGCTVNKEGKVVTPGGDVVGRLVSGDAHVLFGRAVDEDGDILDRNGNSIGKAERWDEPVEEKKKGPMAGRRVNREGLVVDDDGNVIGKLTTGEITICSGKEIDDDGDVVNSKGQVVGHASLLEDIPPEEVEEGETEEERNEREQLEHDRDLANKIAFCVEQSLERIRPICKLITQTIDRAERQPEDERDEEGLVKEVKPLLEEGGRILQEANGLIRGLDPDGRIQAQAKHRSATREASPEEFHLADVLKELTGTVTECIENAKRKIEGMPHAKKELNPMWGLLTEPLFQILAAVGLLLAGVLGLVGRLLSGLGLGGLLDGLLGNLGITRVLNGLGIGSVVGAITGKKKK